MKQFFKVGLNRILSIRRDLSFFALLSIIIVFLIEFWLIDIPSIYQFQYPTGQIVLKLSYSYFSAFMFYILIIHLPKEKRRLKLWRQVNNKVAYIHREVRGITMNLISNSNIEAKHYNITKEQFLEACLQVNPSNSIAPQMPYNKYFPNWYSYLDNKMKLIQKLIIDLLILQEALSSETLEIITFVDNSAEKYLRITNGVIPANNNLEFLSTDLLDLYEYTNNLITVTRKDYKLLEKEYNFEQRKLNVKKNKLEKK